jgi:hypothetical protein
MSASRTILSFVLFAGLGAGSARAVDVSINFSNAETNFGYVNTSLHTLGSLYFQTRGSSEVIYLVDINSPDAKRSNTVSVGSIESSAPRNVSFSFGLTGLEVLSEAAITSAARRSARFFVKNVTTEQYAAPLAIVNSPELAGDRLTYSAFCPPATCRFIFVYHVTKVDEGGFGFGRAFEVGGKLGFPATAKIAGFSANIGYEASQALTWQGQGSPMFYKILRLVLVERGDNYIFVPDISKPPRKAKP